jgi:two-component system chemotaxis response regulator CheY
MHSITISELGVFLVEPSGVQAQFITRRLEELGVIRIATFADAHSALAEMRRQPPDLVISSLHLPDMSGAELVRAMRDDEQLREIAFILVSSETKPHYLEPVRQAGACAILPKPVETATLRTALLASLDYLQPNTLKLDVSGIDLESLRVLVVDDSRSARAFIRRVLENLGIVNITEAENGRQAAEIVNEGYFDLVVTDYNMPEMDGRELTEFIRTKSWQGSLPIMMVSSEQNQERLAAVQQAGVSGICDKPFEPAVVKDLIERMLAT